MTLFGWPVLELPKGFTNGGRERSRSGRLLKEEIGNDRYGHGSHAGGRLASGTASAVTDGR